MCLIARIGHIKSLSTEKVLKWIWTCHLESESRTWRTTTMATAQIIVWKACLCSPSRIVCIRVVQRVNCTHGNEVFLANPYGSSLTITYELHLVIFSATSFQDFRDGINTYTIFHIISYNYSHLEVDRIYRMLKAIFPTLVRFLWNGHIYSMMTIIYYNLIYVYIIIFHNYITI